MQRPPVRTGDIFEHCLTTISESGSLNRCDVECAAQLVHDKSSEGFALDVFSDDEKRLASLGNLLEHWKEILEVGDLLFVDEDVCILKVTIHGIRIGHEVRGEVALVELHSFNNVESRLDAFGFFHGDGAVLANLVHSICDDTADFLVPVSRNGCNLRDFL